MYKEASLDDRKPKSLVYAVGDSKLAQKWKSDWLKLASSTKVQRDPGLSMKKPKISGVESERVKPLNQISAYCRFAETRYAFILTQEELVALRIRRIPIPAANKEPNKRYAAVEYAGVPLTAETGLTANLAIWTLACIGMNDACRAMETAGNKPMDAMERLTRWTFDAKANVYENVISKRKIPGGEWKSEYDKIAHLAHQTDDGFSFTKDFLSVPKLPAGGVSALTQQMQALNVGKSHQPPPPSAPKPASSTPVKPVGKIAPPSAATKPLGVKPAAAATPVTPVGKGAPPAAATKPLGVNPPAGAASSMPSTRTVYIEQQTLPANWENATKQWFVTYQGQKLPIVRNSSGSGRGHVITYNGRQIEAKFI